MDISILIFAFLAAVAGGFINAIAGGGTLVTFPVLIALGISPLAANITNTIALCPGYISGAFAQRKDFKSQKQKLWKILPVSILGGVIGGILLLNTEESVFRILIPYLIFIATCILAIQVPVKKWIINRSKLSGSEKTSDRLLFLMIFLSAIYGGYFGAGLGVILMAVLGLIINDSLNKINALKQAISFSINFVAAIYFSFSGKAYWIIAFVMAIGAISGGVIGGKLASKIKQEIFRWIIVIIGLIVAIYYFVK